MESFVSPLPFILALIFGRFGRFWKLITSSAIGTPQLKLQCPVSKQRRASRHLSLEALSISSFKVSHLSDVFGRPLGLGHPQIPLRCRTFAGKGKSVFKTMKGAPLSVEDVTVFRRLTGLERASYDALINEMRCTQGAMQVCCNQHC